jgi:hypothetical protein
MSADDLTHINIDAFFAAGFDQHTYPELLDVFTPLVGKTVTLDVLLRIEDQWDYINDDTVLITYTAVVRTHQGEVTRLSKSGSNLAVSLNYGYGSEEVLLSGGIREIGVEPRRYRLTDLT